MSDYIDAGDELIIAPSQLIEMANDYLEEQFPGWTASLGGLPLALMEVFAEWASTTISSARDVPKSIFKFFGSIVNIPPLDSTHAVGVATVVAKPGMSGTLYASTELALADVAFSVDSDTAVGIGGTAFVSITAVEEGAGGNDLSGTAELLDTLSGTDWILSITVSTDTAGGADEEDLDAYLDRLSGELELLSPRLILPGDFELFARRRASSIVSRIVALDGYDPDTATHNNERTVGVCAVGATGEPLTGPNKTYLVGLLEAEREMNFIVKAFDPTYTSVGFYYSVHKVPNIDISVPSLLASCDAALSEMVDPSIFGSVPYGDSDDLVATPLLRYLEVAEALNRVEGVWHLNELMMGIVNVGVTVDATADTLTIAGHGAANGDTCVITDQGSPACSLNENRRYYVRDAAANTFKLSLTPGGSAINVTTGTSNATVLLPKPHVDVALPGAVPLTRFAGAAGVVE
jgi:Baseplate J-like protein